ncbi:MAG: hypothetical protein KA419_05070 [Acidobacteria bacterium]|nr:hypothetical protein [Acidobacteriota bacterium]
MKQPFVWKPFAVIAFAFLFLVPAPPAQDTAEEKLAIARSLHEQMSLCIQKGDYPKLEEGFRKLIGLRLQGRYEKAVVDEVQILSEQLVRRGALDVAMSLVDSALAALREKESQSRLLKEKGLLYKQQGKTDKAMEMFEAARKIETAAP